MHLEFRLKSDVLFCVSCFADLFYNLTRFDACMNLFQTHGGHLTRNWLVQLTHVFLLGALNSVHSQVMF